MHLRTLECLSSRRFVLYSKWCYNIGKVVPTIVDVFVQISTRDSLSFLEYSILSSIKRYQELYKILCQMEKKQLQHTLTTTHFLLLLFFPEEALLHKRSTEEPLASSSFSVGVYFERFSHVDLLLAKNRMIIE